MSRHQTTPRLLDVVEARRPRRAARRRRPDTASRWRGPTASFSCVCCHRNSPSDSRNAISTPRSPRLLRIAQRFVVGADEHHAAGDDRVAVALRAELGHPLDVLLGLDVPLGRQALHVRDHVAVGRAAPHRPVAGARDRTRRAARGAGDGRSRTSDEREQDAFSLLIGRHLEVVEIRAELRVDEEARARPAGCRSDRSCRSSMPRARARRSATPCPARAPCRSAGSRRAASGDTRCRPSRRTAP